MGERSGVSVRTVRKQETCRSADHRGRTVNPAGGRSGGRAIWQHDGGAKGPRPIGRGTCFVVIGLVVELPFLARPVCLPVTGSP